MQGVFTKRLWHFILALNANSFNGKISLVRYPYMTLVKREFDCMSYPHITSVV